MDSVLYCTGYCDPSPSVIEGPANGRRALREHRDRPTLPEASREECLECLECQL